MNGESMVLPKVASSLPPPSHLASADVRSAIIAALRWKHVREDDIEDLTHDVLVKALALRDLPATLPECVKLLRKMATDLAIDSLRKRRIRGRFNVGPCEDPDERPVPQAAPSEIRDPIDLHRQIDFARRQLEEGEITPRQAAIIEAEVNGVPQLEIAARLDIAYQTVRNELARGRRILRESWAAHVTMALFVLAGLLASLLRGRHPTLEATDVPEPRTDHVIAPPEFGPEDLAEALRRQALRACAVHRWVDCYETLDRAAEIDPAGDAKPWVQKARREALRQMDRK
jgi:DNA-directed RNA polymerase specialized sigma24 family protein